MSHHGLVTRDLLSPAYTPAATYSLIAPVCLCQPEPAGLRPSNAHNAPQPLR